MVDLTALLPDAGHVRLGFDPWVDPLWLLVLTLAALIGSTCYAFRRGDALWTRMGAMALLLLALAHPIGVVEKRKALNDIALIISDESDSQRVTKRTEQVQKRVADLKSKIEQIGGIETRIVSIKDGITGTQLIPALKTGADDIAGSRLAGTIIVTDGQIHDLPANQKALRAYGPIHALIIGDPDLRDRRLQILRSPQYGIVGAKSEIEFQIDDNPARSGNGANAIVRVIVNGRAQTRFAARIGARQIVSVRLDRRGNNVVTLDVEPVAGEVSLANNRAAMAIAGIRDRLRVLLVTGAPYQGGRVWRNLLRSDPSVDLVHFTILRPPDKQDDTPTEELSLIPFPTRELFEEKIDDFDLIIFDRYSYDGILLSIYFDNIVRRVENGGALLVVAGPSYAGGNSLFLSPLAAILPARPLGSVAEGAFRPQIAAGARNHPVIRGLEPGPEAAPWGRWFRYVPSSVIAGRTLLSTPGGSPILVIHEAAKGRVAILLSDQIWLWSRGFEGGGPHSEMLRRVAHWLMREPDLEAERLTAKESDGQIEIERSSEKDIVALASLTSPSGRQSRIALVPSRPDDPEVGANADPDNAGSRAVKVIQPDPNSSVQPSEQQANINEQAPGFIRNFHGETRADEAGLWTIEAGGLKTELAIGPPSPLELAHLEASDAILEPLARLTGGGIISVSNGGQDSPAIRHVDRRASAHGPNWFGLRRRAAYQIEETRSITLLPAWLMALSALGLMMMAWRREGR